MTTKLFAVTGRPALHSKSPLLFAGAYPGSPHAYFRLAARSPGEALRLFEELDLSGMNVTAPFKTDIARLIDQRSPEVQLLGAANTVTRDPLGRLRAHNTDPLGVDGALAAAGVDPRDKTCIVLGAGGAGTAAAHALQRAGARVTVLNRNVDKARALAARLSCAHAPLDSPSLIAAADVIVNTLPPGVEIVREEWLSARQVILDALYRGSALREQAARRRAAYIDGMQWLLHQGAPAYRLFAGVEPNLDGMEQALRDQPPLPRHIAFVGFMGAGKSTAARALAGKLGLALADSDKIIEQQNGKSIPRQIQEDGEASFREQEEKTLRALLLANSPTIISCGGGAVNNPETRALLRARALVIWLHASTEQCLRRINIASRPLLARSDDPRQAAAEIYRTRKHLYASVADLLVDTSGRTSEQVNQIIHEEINTCIRG
ncbi:MAG: AAA family ATPase [Odoribacteraceae bacterium]|jgi:shikimate dehydrogenase|nr:AAA family ATPase [Odoribacteraceae bacterium]